MGTKEASSMVGGQVASVPLTENKFVRGLILTGVSLVLLTLLLYGGDLLATLRSAGKAYGLGPTPEFGLKGWVTWVGIGSIILYLSYLSAADRQLVKIDGRVIGLGLLGALLYGLTAWVFNIVPVPAITLINLRPAVIVPAFFGLAFGPLAGFLAGAGGNVLGDALTGWGVFPTYAIANGLMGLMPGLARAYLLKGEQSSQHKLLLGIVSAALILSIAMPLIEPIIVNPFTGQEVNYQSWSSVMFIVLALLLVTALQPQYWRYMLILMVLGLIAFGVKGLLDTGFTTGVMLVWAVALLTILAAAYLYMKEKSIDKWLDHDSLRTIAVWGALGVVMGIGFAALSDIFRNERTFAASFVGVFIPATGPNILFISLLSPLAYAVWKRTKAEPNDS